MHARQYTRKIIAFLLCITFMLFTFSPAHAMSIIRDSEIETTLKDWLKPMLDAAGMGVNDVNIVLVGSDEINAFVAGGRNIFIYTGLILEAERADEVLGVMAHELGHIQGGHLVRMREEIEMASYQSMLAGILGIGVAAIGGQSELGTAIYSGGASAAGLNYLKFSRAQESSADQAALRYFEAAGFTAEGLVSFMQKMEGQELLSSQYQNQYMRTHPVTRDRVQAMQAGLNRSAHSKTAMPSQWQEQFERMKAKIQAYNEPAYAIGVYGDKYDTIPGLYALAIVDYRQGRMDDAAAKMDKLIAKEPKNPYFHEFKGQILLESQHITEAVKSYEKSLALKPDADLIRIDLAQCYIALAGQDNDKLLMKARDQLMLAKKRENKTPRLHRLLATVYGRLGQDGQAQVALAEEAVMLGKYKDARMFAQRAQMVLKENSPNAATSDRGAWLKAQDIIQYVNNKKDTD